MKEITLSNGMIARVDDEDYERLCVFVWTFDPKGKGYARTKIAGVGLVFMHRMLLDAPSDVEVDHEDGDGLHNCRSNLRLATHSQNQQNTAISVRNKTGYKGVHWDTAKQKFRAQIMKDKKVRKLGRFDTAEEAAIAYDKAAREMFGQFARLNFPNPGERSAR